MPQNFLACDREQPFLLPPDVREWLPEDHTFDERRFRAVTPIGDGAFTILPADA